MLVRKSTAVAKRLMMKMMDDGCNQDHLIFKPNKTASHKRKIALYPIPSP